MGARNCSVPVVPYIVRPRQAHGPDLRSELGIPRDATVFGRHGGQLTFNSHVALEAVKLVAAERPDIFFVFMNTKNNSRFGQRRPNIILLDRSADEERKSRFIRTCDAMIHGRVQGETFGLAIAEFSAHNRPVLTTGTTYKDKQKGTMHLELLGERAMVYASVNSLKKLLHTFNRTEVSRQDWNAYREFEPEAVMRTFYDVFLRCEPPRGLAHLRL